MFKYLLHILILMKRLLIALAIIATLFVAGCGGPALEDMGTDVKAFNAKLSECGPAKVQTQGMTIEARGFETGMCGFGSMTFKCEACNLRYIKGDKKMDCSVPKDALDIVLDYYGGVTYYDDILKYCDGSL
jgi:predicted small secreted protein